MFDVDRVLNELAARRKGAILRREARARGVSRHELDDRVAAGILIPVHDGLYRHAAVRYSQALRDVLAVLACGPDALLSHRSAAQLRRYPVRAVRPTVTTPHPDLPRVEGVEIHRTNHLEPFECTVIDGIPVTSGPRTALDLCAVLPLHVAREVIAEAVITKRLTPEEVVIGIERSGGRGRPGTATLRAVAFDLPELEGIESVLEWEVVQLLERAQVPPPVRQLELTCDDGRRVRLDLSWPDVRMALEPNGRRWHDTPARRRRTDERQRSIRASGWEHRHIGLGDVRCDPAEVVAWVEETYWRRQADAA